MISADLPKKPGAPFAVSANVSRMSNRLRELRKRPRPGKPKGMTLEEVGELAGMSYVQVGRLEKGDRQLKDHQIRALAGALGVSPEDVMAEPAGVVVAGTVGVSGQTRHAIVSPAADHETVPCPRGLDPQETECVRIAGNDFEPALGEGWLAFYKRATDKAGVSEAALGKLCVAHTERGETILGQVMRAPTPGRFNVLGINMPLLQDLSLEWAAPVVELLSPLAQAFREGTARGKASISEKAAASHPSGC